MTKFDEKIITYTALSLVLSLPFSAAFAEAVKTAPAEKPAATAKTAAAPVVAAATVATASPVAQANTTASTEERKILTEKLQKIAHEARDAVSEIGQALVALDNKDSKTALSTLNSASTNLDAVLGKNPGITLIPVDVDVDIIDFDGDNNTVKAAISEAKTLLDNSQIQAVRKIVAVLASEMRITTDSIPLSSFPGAVKEAAKAVEAGKTADAIKILNDALDTVVETVDIMPLPILRAEALLTEAAILEHTQDLSKEKSREAVLKFAEASKNQLKLAELLGYGNKDDFQLMYTAIDELKDVIATEKSAATWDKIKKMFVDLKNKIMPSKN
jgi:hypothetical protein